MTGPPLVSTPGNWWGMTPGVGSVFNNGVPYPGADHIQLAFGWPDGTVQEVCIHYSPGPGHR
jgi:hypothetical protein